MLRYIHRIKARLKALFVRVRRALRILFNTEDAELQQYVTAAPTPQNAVDLFKGEWSGSFPEPLHELQAGPLPLHRDDRLAWALEQLGGVAGKRVLELGPLEAGHTYMLEQAGAAAVTAIEANARAYLKCLVVKELAGLHKSAFLCGDFMGYMRASAEKFDVCVASGVLYHMRDPVELIALAAARCNALYIWTHYYDATECHRTPQLSERFCGSAPAEHGGFKHTLYRFEYQSARVFTSFCGGSDLYSHWLTRGDILACCRHFGLTDIHIGHDQPGHPNGPSFALTAQRPAPR